MKRRAPAPPAPLRNHLDAVIAGVAPQRVDVPDAECLAISRAIAECAEASMAETPWGRAKTDALPLPSRLLPPLP